MARLPGLTARERRRKSSKDARYAAKIRERVFERDGICRANCWQDHRNVGPCKGVWEWAHFGDKRRFKTRGLPPEERHTTAGSLVLCTAHHQYYDQGRLTITARTDMGCDGSIQFIASQSRHAKRGAA